MSKGLMPMSLKVTFELGQVPEFSLFPGRSPCYRGLQVNEKGKDSLRELPYEIVDFDTGQYEALGAGRQTSQAIERCPDMPRNGSPELKCRLGLLIRG